MAAAVVAYLTVGSEANFYGLCKIYAWGNKLFTNMNYSSVALYFTHIKQDNI